MIVFRPPSVTSIFDFCATSVKGHRGNFSVVPRCHLGSSAQSKEFAGTRLVNHALFFALVQKLLLSGGQGDRLSSSVLLLVLMEAEILISSVHLLVRLAIKETGPESGPGRHEELLLVGLDIDDAVLVLHQVLKAGSRVHHRGDRHWRTHKTEE